MSTTQQEQDAAFTAFVTETGPRLRRTAHLLAGDHHRGEDLLQATLVKTYLAWPRAQATDPEAYARRVLANQRIDTWRKHRREVLTAPADVPDRLDEPADTAADRDAVVRALLTLTARQRRIVVLRHLVGLTDAEVAADLGVSVGTVKSTASRALAQLRAELGAEPDVEGVARAAGVPAAPQAEAVIDRARAVRRRRRALLGSAAAVALIVVAVVGGRLTQASAPAAAPLGDYPAWDSYAAMAASAGAVVEGEVLDSRSADVDVAPGPSDATMRYEVYRVRVVRDYGGTTGPGDVLDVKILAQEGAEDTGPELEQGARYVLFLSAPYDDGVPRDLMNPWQAAYRVTAEGAYAVVAPLDGEVLPPLTQADLDAISPAP